MQQSGLSTSLAVAFHEIPQELGDYGVLIKAGFTKPYALFFNFITACTAFLGVIIGLGRHSVRVLPPTNQHYIDRTFVFRRW